MSNWFDSNEKFPTSSQTEMSHWAQPQLRLRAAREGKVFYKNSLSGTITLKFNELLSKFEELGLKVVAKAYNSHCKFFNNFELINSDSYVEIDTNSNDISTAYWFVNLNTLDKDLFDKFEQLRKYFKITVTKHGEVYSLLATENGLSIEEIGVAGMPFERGNYTPDVVEAYDKIVADLSGSNPTGRLTILEGPPGTGKTTLVKALLNESIQAKFVIVQAYDVEALAGPKVLGVLVREYSQAKQPIVLILEDADECLVGRDRANTSAISSLLNITDGILGSVLDIRVIATTNAKKTEFDKAITRSGRLSQHIHIKALPGDLAEKVYVRIVGKPSKFFENSKEYVLSDIYRRAVGDGWSPKVETKKSVGFTANKQRDPWEDGDL